MKKENDNVYEAKQSLKSHIKFFEALLSHVSGNDESLKSRAMFATWCLHQYINNGLMVDIENAIKECIEQKDSH